MKANPTGEVRHTPKSIRSAARRTSDDRRGLERRRAVERGRTIGFYIKELARKALTERGKPGHFR